MKRLWPVLLAVVMLLPILYLLRRDTSTPRIGPQQITIAQFGDFFLYAPLYIAIDAGFFAEHELDVSLISTGGDEKTWAAVLSGDAAFGVADPTFIAIAAERGQPGKVIASIVNGVPFWGVSLNPAIGPIDSASDLQGYTVATFPSPSTAFALQAKMFQDAGLSPSIREGAFGTLIPMLRAGQADIALELEPNVSQAIAQGAHVVYSMKDVYGDFAITALTTTPAFIAENDQLTQDVVCSLQRALDFVRVQPDSALVILTKRFPEIDAQVAADALRRVVEQGIIPSDVTIGSEAWDRALELRTQIGDLANPGPITTYVDNSYAQRASRSCRLE